MRDPTHDSISVWRDAVKDAEHPRHQTAWLMFSEGTKPKAAAKLLAARRDEVIPWLYEILDEPRLYKVDSLGVGYAPIHAIELLGEWRVLEAAPRLLKIVVEDSGIDDGPTIAFDRACIALENFGVVPEIAALIREYIADDRYRDSHDTLASMLADNGKGDPESYDTIMTVFKRASAEHSVTYLAEALLICDQQRAIDDLESMLHSGRYSRAVRERLTQYIEDARAGNFP